MGAAMLLRRITQHVKEQNWFAVGLDFVIVVFGVFIGLQVANWNDGRAERVQASDLMARMVFEADIARSELADYKQDHLQIKDEVTALAVAVIDKDACLAMSDALMLSIVGIADFPPPRFSLSNAQQALDTGSVALIRSSEVRASVQTITDEMTFIDRQWQRYEKIKQAAHTQSNAAAGVVLTGRGARLLGVVSGYDPESYELLTPEKFCGNTEIATQLTDASVTQTIYVDYLEQVQEALDEYISVLNKEET